MIEAILKLGSRALEKREVGTIEEGTASESVLEWYLVMSHPREERKAEENLKAQGLTVLLPRYAKERLYRGRRVVREEPLFPRYLFVELNWSQGQGSTIRSTRGVSALVRFGLHPAKVPRVWINYLKAQEALRNQSIEPLFRPGDKVRIVEGAYQGLEGIYERPLGEDRVEVLLRLMGREAKCPLEVGAIKTLE